MAQLIFHVENQYIHRLDEFYVVARSNNYLYAEFTFTDDWVGEKTALFSVEADNGETITKPMLIGADGTCEVPHEVLEYDNSQLEVSAFCGDRVTANVAVVPVHESGYNDDSAPDDPTPDVYTQILNRLANVEQIVIDKATEAESWAVGGTDTREDEDIDNSKYYAEQAGISATAAAASATNALESAENASDSASSAHTDAGVASQKSAETIEAKESVDSSLVEMREIETNVGTLANNAAKSADEASESMSAAKEYSDAASASARTASTAASDAASSASYVSGAVSRAAGYATNAQNYASAADRSMQSAATSERNAAQSSTNAATYASNAEESATNSALSASDSNGYAGAALQSANEALEAQTAAESARDDAEAAKTVAETAAQNIQASAQQIATNTQNIATNTADIAQNTSDITDIKSNLNELQTGKADIIISSAEGTVASFPDGAEADAVSVIAHIEPVQDLHGYDNPWPAGGGVNKFDLASSFTEGETVTNNGITATFSNGYLKITGTNTRGSSFNIIYKNISGFLSAGTYIMPNHVTVRASIDGGSNANYATVMTASTGMSLVAFYVVISASATNLNWNIPLLLVEGTTSPTTYSPYSNICPISGWDSVEVQRTGKNLFDINRVQGTPIPSTLLESPRVMETNKWYKGLRADNYYYADYVSGTIENGVLTVHTFTNVNYGIGFPISCKPNTTYIISAEQTGCNFSVGCYDKDWNYLSRLLGMTTYVSPLSFTTPNNAEYITVIIGSVVNGEGIARNIQLELGSTATAYEPYQGETYPISWQTEAGEVFGGYIDVTRGKVVAEWGNIASYNGETLPGRWISDRDVYASGTTPSIGAQVVYELATPIEYDITPTAIELLKGYNNVWNSAGGNNEVQYKADTKLYIDNLLGATEDDMTANANIASGKFFSVGNRLFLSTAAIAQGATITPGTNCTELTISDALNQVNA